MKLRTVSTALVAAGLLVAAPVLAQTNPTPANSAPTTSSAKQPTDGESPTNVGPGSKAFKQRTQSMAHAAPMKQPTDGESPTLVGPGSGAYKQRTDGESPTLVGPGSGAFKAN